MIADNYIPTAPKDLIRGQVEGYNYFLNPRGHHGVLVFFGRRS